MFFVLPTQIIITSTHTNLYDYKKGRTTNPITEYKSKTTNKFWIFFFFLQHKHIHNNISSNHNTTHTLFVCRTIHIHDIEEKRTRKRTTFKISIDNNKIDGIYEYEFIK